MAILRSIVFYAVFYGGSALYVLAAVLSLTLAPRKVVPIADAWSAFHRACVRYILGIKVEITGERPDQPVLYAIKHESFFEAVDLPNLLDHPAGFAKKQLFDIPGWGRAARAYGAIPVDRDAGAKALRTMVRDARQYLDEGRSLVIFPEGTRAPVGTQPPLRSGFAALYQVLGLPVVPVAVNSGKTYHNTWKKRGRIEIRFCDQIEPGLPRDEIEARVHQAINTLND